MNGTNARADYVEITDIKSDVYAKPPNGEQSDMFLVTPENVEEKCDGRPQLHEIAWEVTKGTYGPKTLIKECEHTTAVCPECGSIGRYDERGEVCCVDDSCGMIISGGTEPMYHESYEQQSGDSVAGQVTAEPEPDVQ